MTLPNELVLPTKAMHERLGLKQPKLVEASKAINLRKLRHVHPDTGTETLYIAVADILALLDREYEVTESVHVAGVAKAIRQTTGVQA